MKVALIACAAWFALTSCASPFYKSAPFSAQVVDSETGQPIAGAVVVASWELEKGSLDGSRHVGYLEVKETLTDANGRFSFEGFSKANSSGGELRDADPAVLVFKGQYEAASFFSSWNPGRPAGPFRTAWVDGKVLKLSKIDTANSERGLRRRTFHRTLNSRINNIIADCLWSRIPRLLMAMSEEKQRILSLYPEAYVLIGPKDFAGAVEREECSFTENSLKGAIK